MVSDEQIRELVERLATLGRCLNIEQRRIDLSNEEEKTQEPNFWDDPERAQEQLRKVSSIKSWITDFDALASVVGDVELVPDFLREGVMSEAEADALYADALEKTESLELRNMLQGEEDKMGAIMDINAGAGGTEALDWASMLLRMYTRWGEAHGYKVRIQDYQAGDEVGVRLRYLYKDPDTGVEEEILIENTETRDQPKYRENALLILRSKLFQRELDRRMATQQALEATKKRIEWGSQIRSYVFDDRRVKDHRTGCQTSNVEAVMDGEIDQFIKSFLMQFGAEV